MKVGMVLGRVAVGSIVCLLMMSSFMLLGSTVPTQHAQTQSQQVVNPSITFRLPCSQSSTVENLGGGNYGNSTTAYVSNFYWLYPGGSSFFYNRAYWMFNLSSLPSNFVIDSAVANFYIEAVWNYNYSATGFGAIGVQIYRAVANWNETTISWANQPYNGASQYLVSMLQVPRIAPGHIPGYDGTNPDPNDPVNNTYQEQIFDSYIPLDLTTLAQKWQSGQVTNHGIIMDTSSPGWYDQFDSEIDFNSRFMAYDEQNAPFIEIVGHSMETQVHLSYYDAFTGEGIAPYSFNVSTSVNGGPFTRADPTITNGIFGLPLTIRVSDFFGNALYNQTRVILTSTYYWDIGLPIYDYKFDNQNPSFAMLKVFYNLHNPPYSEFIPPNDYVELYLKAGTYRFNITAYSATGVQGHEYTWVRTIPSVTFPGAGFVILTGETLNGLNITIQEVVTSVQGMQALINVVTSLVQPSVIWIGRGVPQIPSYILTVSNQIMVNNWWMLSATTVSSGNGTIIDFPSPVPSSALGSTISTDLFYFSGPYSTSLWVNDSSTGLVKYHSATLPAIVAVTGSGHYDVQASQNVSCSRVVTFRFYQSFTYLYTPATEFYSGQVTVHNGLTTAWYNATLFIPFMNNSYVDNRSVQVWDMNNTVYLTQGVHWVQSQQGVYMWFNTWNQSTYRGFKLSYYAINETNLTAPVHIVINTVGNGTGQITRTWNGATFYFAVGSWTNDRRELYDGAIYIDLTFTTVSVDPSSIIVLGNNDNVISGVIVAGNTIIIPEVNVPVGDKVTYTILFNSNQNKNIFELSFANIPIVMTSSFLAIFAFILGIYFTQFRKDKVSEQWGRMFVGVAVIALFLIIIVFIYFLGIMS